MPIKDELISMGFPSSRVDGAIRAKGQDVEACLQYLIDMPAMADEGSSHLEKELMAMGCERERIRSAIRAKGEELEAALQWLIEDGERSQEARAAGPPPKAQRRSEPEPLAAPELPPLANATDPPILESPAPPDTATFPPTAPS